MNWCHDAELQTEHHDGFTQSSVVNNTCGVFLFLFWYTVYNHIIAVYRMSVFKRYAISTSYGVIYMRESVQNWYSDAGGTCTIGYYNLIYGLLSHFDILMYQWWPIFEMLTIKWTGLLVSSENVVGIAGCDLCIFILFKMTPFDSTSDLWEANLAQNWH